MKLSEAIRKGAALRPQGFGMYMSFDRGGQLCSCALGAAMEGLGYTTEQIQYDRSSIARISGYGDIFGDIIRMNDIKRMSRETIADCLVSSYRDIEVTPVMAGPA